MKNQSTLWNLLGSCVALVSVGVGHATYAQASSVDTPLSVDSGTVALWNFDSDSGDQVIDSSSNHLNCTAMSAPLVPSGIPGINAVFLAARQFTGTSSFLDCGTTTGSKLDFSGQTVASVEAYISLQASIPGLHAIFDNGQIQLMLVTDHLAAFVAQPGGYEGVVADQPLDLNTPYRVSMTLSGGRLAIAVNEHIVGNLVVSSPIGATPTQATHALVGGNIISQYFPGYIDDVRVSNVVRYDNVPPSVTSFSPSPSTIVSDPYPTVVATYQDNGPTGFVSGIDASSVQVLLNGVVQTNVTHDASGINSKLSSPLVAGSANEIRIRVSDIQGNVTEYVTFLSYIKLGGGTEYTSDPDTLGLWHMDESAPQFVQDSSAHAYHGYASSVGVGTGVFGKGRIFTGDYNGIRLPSILLPGHQFTWEGWVQPGADVPSQSQEQILFQTSQLKISRFNQGNIRVVLYKTHDLSTSETTYAILPLGELHHLAISWDGTKATNNLIIYRDGLIQQVFSVGGQCDFDPTPGTGAIGANFTGMMDEVRFSDVPRDTFNISTAQEKLNFSTLGENSSVQNANAQLHVQANVSGSLDPTKVKVYLNGVAQSINSGGLTVSGDGIDGNFDTPLQEGLNLIRIEVIDASGNQIVDQHAVFFIRNAGGSEYVPDSDTVGLWHFDDSDASVNPDSSGNGYDFLSQFSTATTVSGVYGNGRGQARLITGSDTSVLLGSRSFTMEGWFSIASVDTSQYTLMQLRGDQAEITLSRVSGSASLHIDFSTQDGEMIQDVPNAFPVDGAFHHVAFIYDSSRAFAQMVVTVDGVVVAVIDRTTFCDFTQPFVFEVGNGGSLSVDEVRLSRRARYAFDLGNSQARPVVDSATPAVEMTIHDTQAAVNYQFHGVQPISTDATQTYLRINGVVQNGLTLSTSGTSGSLQGNVTGLIPGANFFELHVTDVSGQQTVQSGMVYSVLAAPAQPYVDDSATLLLLHLNETSGTQVADSSSKQTDLQLSGTYTLGVPGMFGTTAVSGNGAYLTGTITDLQGQSALTIEGWMNGGSSSQVFETQDVSLGMSNGTLSFNWRWGTGYSSSLQAPVASDSSFHHYAAILDPNGAYRNAYLLKDGAVLASIKTQAGGTTIYGTQNQASMHLNSGTTLDEVRVSAQARYTLAYNPSRSGQPQTPPRQMTGTSASSRSGSRLRNTISQWSTRIRRWFHHLAG